jgi:hypothetical protein
MKRQVIRDIISDRGKEIQRLKAKLKELDERADEDIRGRQDHEAKQLRELQDRISKIEKETQDYVKARTAKLRQEQKPINKIILSLERANELSEASISAIGKTPDEILSLIFREYIGMDYSIWNLVRVTPHWKQVAFATPHLWSAIAIRDHWGGCREVKEDNSTHRYYGRRHVCSETSQMEAILDRCGTVPLDVSIHVYRSYHKSDDIAGLTSCLRLLNSPPIIKRVVCLEFEALSQTLMDSWPECFQSVSLNNLQHLVIREPLSEKWRKNLFTSISNTTSHLRVLATAPKLDANSFPDHIWVGIRSLRLFGQFSATQVDQIIQKIPYCEELSGLPDLWPSRVTPKSSLHNLVSLTCTSDPQSIRRLHLPSLQELDAEDRLSPITSTLNSTSYPMLTSMNLRTSFPERWLTDVSAPVLKSLKLSIGDYSKGPDIYNDTSIKTFSALSSLVISARETAIIALLEALPNLTSITAANGDSMQFGLTLLPRLAEYEGRFLCSPNVKEISLGFGYNSVHTRRGPLVPLIKRLITARKRNDARLLKFGVLWRDIRDHQQYIS